MSHSVVLRATEKTIDCPRRATVQTLAYVRMYVCMYVYMYVCMYVCMCTYIHIYIYYKKLHSNLGCYVCQLLFFHVRPANQSTTTGVATCHKTLETLLSTVLYLLHILITNCRYLP